jgi:hypothetical protein
MPGAFTSRYTDMDDKKSLITNLPPVILAIGALITAIVGLGSFLSTPAPSITGFDANPSIISYGSNVTLKWTVTGEVTSATIEPGIGTIALSGSRRITPLNTTTYVLTARNKGEVKTASVEVVVKEAEEHSAGSTAAAQVNRADPVSVKNLAASQTGAEETTTVEDVPVKNAPVEKSAPKAVQDTSKITGDELVYSSSEPNQAASLFGDEPAKVPSTKTAAVASTPASPSTGDEPAVVKESKISLGDEPVNTQVSGAASEAKDGKNTGDESAAVTNTTTAVASSFAAKDRAKSQAPPKSTGDIA